MLVFFGAEYTKVYALKKGYRIVPSKHAKWSEAKMYEDSLKAGNSDKIHQKDSLSSNI